ncbi:MAG: DMT family transporter, partial [Gammaproteobacteria bacterium]
MWVLLAALAFSGMAVCIKLLGGAMSVWELVLLRSALALVLLTPAFVRAGPRVFMTRRLGTHFVRSCAGMGALVSFFLALTHLDLALATALGFTRALFVIVLAVLLLGEIVRWRRSLATMVGFAGVVVCVNPGAGTFDPWTLSALTFALFGAGVTVFVKRLTSTEAPLAIVFWTYIIMGSLAAAPAVLTWRTPTFTELAIVLLMSLASAAGQTAMVHGLRAGEATAVTPFEYSRLIYAALLGYFMFGEMPDRSTWIGAAIIVASTLY